MRRLLLSIGFWQAVLYGLLIGLGVGGLLVVAVLGPIALQILHS